MLVKSDSTIKFLRYFGDENVNYFDNDSNPVKACCCCIETKCMGGTLARNELLKDIMKWEGVKKLGDKLIVYFYDKTALIIAEYYGFTNPYEDRQLFKMLHFLAWTKDIDPKFLKLFEDTINSGEIADYKEYAFSSNVIKYNILILKFIDIEKELNDKIVRRDTPLTIMSMSFIPVWIEDTRFIWGYFIFNNNHYFIFFNLIPFFTGTIYNQITVGSLVLLPY